LAHLVGGAQVAERDWFLAVGAVPALADTAGEQAAVGASLFVEVAGIRVMHLPRRYRPACWSRRHNAMCRRASTNVTSLMGAINQPTTARENRSIAKAT